MRLMPSWEIRAFGFELPNPFFPGILLMFFVFNGLYMWPFLEARFTKDRDEHHVLQRPRDHPVRTGIGVGIFSFFVLLFLAGANDVITVAFGLSINEFVFLFRILVFVVPPLVFLLTYRLCKELQARDPGELPYDPDKPTDPDLGDATEVTEQIEAKHERAREADRLEATQAVGG